MASESLVTCLPDWKGACSSRRFRGNTGNFRGERVFDETKVFLSPHASIYTASVSRLF